MNTSESNNGASVPANSESDNMDNAQIDWNSFVNLEYDPAIPVASSQGPLVIDKAQLQAVPNDSGIPISDGLAYNMEDLSVAPFEFPSMDEWWAELSHGIESAEWDSFTGASVSQENAPRSDSNSSAYGDWQSPDLDEDGGAKKRRCRMQPEAKRLLTDCFERHEENPYIPKDEIQRLANETGLSLRQVQTFFANARARKWPRPPTKGKGVDIPASTNQQGPMERFLSSSPEDEGISEDAVRTAATKMKSPIKPYPPRKGYPASVSQSSQSSTLNSSSASMDSLDSRGSRRGRKRQREPSHNVAKTIFRKPSSPSRKYQCTFCTLDFGNKYDWKRHEESVHFPQKEWVCMPNGPLENSRCVFCAVGNVDEDHLKVHKSIACSEAAYAQRTFQRKDKLIQHIKQVHGCEPPKMIKEWCRPIGHSVLLLCGFCSLALPDWKTRVDHMSSHFNNGVGMDKWLPELLGGLWPDDDTTTNFIRDRFSATESPEGQFTCDACSARFLNMSNATLHRRQVHNIFMATDTNIVWSRPVAGHHSQRLISLAQQTSRIQIARLETPTGSAPSHIVRLHGPLVKKPDYTAVFSSNSSSKSLGIRPAINRTLEEPETRGFSSAPHSVLQKVLNQGAIAPPRATPARSPLNPHLTTLHSHKSPMARSSLRANNLWNASDAHAEFASQTATNSETARMSNSGPPVDAIRTRLINNRVNVGNTNTPLQGMLHSLEQFDATDAPWPKPPDLHRG